MAKITEAQRKAVESNVEVTKDGYRCKICGKEFKLSYGAASMHILMHLRREQEADDAYCKAHDC